MKGLLYLLCFALIAIVPIAVTAGDCDKCPLNGICTIEVPVTAEIQVATAGHPVLATAGRSVGRRVAKVAAVPVKIIKKIASVRPARKVLKAVAKIKPARRAAALGGRLICPRRRCSE